jgi:small subunit ribosomal protein S7
MSRRRRLIRHPAITESKYHNTVTAKLISRMMKDGKKSTAEKIVYTAMANMEEKEKQPAVQVLAQAVKNSTPALQVKSRRIGGANYQVPVEVRPERGLSLALTWLVTAARARSGKSMIDKLTAELTDAAHGQGATVKKRDDTHRMADANRAFAHYRW